MIDVLGVPCSADENRSNQSFKEAVDELINFADEYISSMTTAIATSEPRRQTLLRALRLNIATKMAYRIKFSKASNKVSETQRLDDALFELAARKIFAWSGNIHDQVKKQSQLPIKSGGLGLIRLATRVKVRELGAIFNNPLMDEWNETQEIEDMISSFPLPSKSKKEFHVVEDLRCILEKRNGYKQLLSGMERRLCDLVDEKELDEFEDGLLQNPHVLERWTSTKSREAGRFILANPIYKSLQLTDIEFTLAVNRRVGKHFIKENVNCPFCDDVLVDEIGEHSLRCKKVGKAIPHNAVRDTLFGYGKKALNNSHIQMDCELPLNLANGFTSLEDEQHTRRGDIVISDNVRNLKIIIDISLTSIHGTPNMLNYDGYSIKVAEELKLKWYQGKFSLANVRIIPGIIDSMGRWGHGFKKFMMELAKGATGVNNNLWLYNRHINMIRDLVSVSHMRAISRSIMHPQ